jgi:acid phosphatase type 7
MNRTARWFTTSFAGIILLLSTSIQASTHVTKLPPDGSLRILTWLVAGPLPSKSIIREKDEYPRRKGYDTDYLASIGGEKQARISDGQTFSVDGRTFTFKPHTWEGPYIDIADQLGRRSEVCVYLYAEIESPEEQKIIAHFGSNDAGKAWVGGKLIASYPGDRTAHSMQETASVTLEKGRTPVLLKIDQAGGGWGAYFSVFKPGNHQRYLRETFPKVFFITCNREYPRVGDKLTFTIRNMGACADLDVPISWKMVDGEKVTPIKGNGITVETAISTGKARHIAIEAEAVQPLGGIVRGTANVFVNTLAGDFFAPTRKPDHIVLSLDVAGDTDRRIAWRTNTNTTGTVAQIVNYPGSSDIDWSSTRVKTIRGTCDTLRSTTSAARFHNVAFKGLKQGARYAYRVGDGSADGWSRVYVTDIPETDERVKIAIVGDTRSQMNIWAKVISSIEKHKPAFIAHSGDIVANGHNMDQWNRWFYEARDVLPVIPMMPVLGNHEGQAPEYFSSFSLPENAPVADKEQWYSFDFGPTHWVMLNTCYKADEQVPWMDRDFSASRKPWSFATYHYPLYAGHPARGDGDLTTREKWEPVFNRHDLTVGWQGHDHYYFRTKPIKGGKIVPDGKGTVYVVAGGGGAPISASTPNKWMVKGEKSHHYIIMVATKTTAKYTAYRLDGSILDTFGMKR